MVDDSHSPSEHSSLLNLRRLLLLRSIAIAGWLAAVMLVSYDLGTRAMLLPAGLVIAIWSLLNVVSWRWLGAAREVSHREFFCQLLLDAGAITVLLYFTGGSTNPFTLLYLLPLTVAAAVLPARYTWMLAALTTICYTMLLLFYVPLPLMMNAGREEFGLHVLGMWSGFVLSAGLIAYFVVKMGNTLRERERILAEAREKSLRDERLIALGTLAAGAAHELGTPLATMAILTKELEREHREASPALAEQLRTLREQVDRCKGALSVLSASAGQVRVESGGRLPVDGYLQQIVAEWCKLRPAVTVRCRWNGSGAAPVVVAERTLTQAIMNVLNNAADASAHSVEINARWDERQWLIEVGDRGEGLSRAVSARAGKGVFTTKGEGQGLGLGLFLAYSTIGRFGGSIQLFNRDGGGACTRIVLPLIRLSAA